MKTYQPKQKDVKRNWHLMDAKDKVLGRMASEIVKLLMGKQKPTYANHIDMGDYVIVINAKEVELTGKKKKQKLYKSHSGYPGGFKEIKFSKILNEKPEKIVEHAVSGMLPGNRLKRERMRRLRIFAGEEHPYGNKLK